jgi:hypothetical protein
MPVLRDAQVTGEPGSYVMTLDRDDLVQLVTFAVQAGALYAARNPDLFLTATLGDQYDALINHADHRDLWSLPDVLESPVYDTMDSLLHGTVADDGEPWQPGSFRGCETPGHCYPTTQHGG